MQSSCRGSIPHLRSDKSRASVRAKQTKRLEEMRPDLVNAAARTGIAVRQEGIVARRGEIRRIRQARLFWQGLQYAWWNPQDMTWHLPYESKNHDDSADGGDAALPVRHEYIFRRSASRSFPSSARTCRDAFLSAIGAVDRRHHTRESCRRRCRT